MHSGSSPLGHVLLISDLHYSQKHRRSKRSPAKQKVITFQNPLGLRFSDSCEEIKYRNSAREMKTISIEKKGKSGSNKTPIRSFSKPCIKSGRGHSGAIHWFVDELHILLDSLSFFATGSNTRGRSQATEFEHSGEGLRFKNGNTNMSNGNRAQSKSYAYVFHSGRSLRALFDSK